MKSFVVNRSLQKSISILLIISSFTSQSYALSVSRNSTQGLPTAASELGQAPETGDEYFLTEAILLDENKQPLCHVNLAGQAELAPRFASVAPEGMQSSTHMNLRACDENESTLIGMTSQKAVERAQTAALPAFILAGVAICEMTGLVGGVLGGATAAGLYTATGNVPGTIIGTLEGFTRLAGKTRLIRYVAGGPIGYICGSLGDLAGYTGVYFLLEKAQQKGWIPKHQAKTK